jgi:hypothetical protein
MQKQHAHLILLVFDILACFGVYWSVSHYLHVTYLINIGASEIVFEPSIFYLVFALVVPFMHILSWLSMKKWAMFIIQRQVLALALLILSLVATKICLIYKTEEQLEQHEYVSCSILVKGRYQSEIYKKTACDP